MDHAARRAEAIPAEQASPPGAVRWGSLDVLRGLALYLMVAHHLAKWTGGRVAERFVGFEGLLVTDIAAPIFAVGAGAAAFLVGQRISAGRRPDLGRARTALWRWTQVMLAGLAIDVAVGGGIDGGGVLPSLAVLGVIVTGISAAGVRRPATWWALAAAVTLAVGPARDLAGDGFWSRLVNGSFSIAVYGTFAAAGAAVAAHATGRRGGEDHLPLVRAAAGVLVAGVVGAAVVPGLVAPEGLWPPDRYPGYLPFTMWGLVATFALWAFVRRALPDTSWLGAAAARAGRRTLLLFMGHYVIKLFLQHTDRLGTLDTWRWGLAAWAATLAICVTASLPWREWQAARSRG